MRIAIVSDIHGNIEAFRQVLADADRSRVDSVICLGDNVGYGPEPDAVVQQIRERRIPSIMGNHEMGLIDSTFLDWFNPPTRDSLLLTRKLVSSDTMSYIRDLQPTLVVEDALCVHGCPPDSVATYLFEISHGQLQQILSLMKEKICFVGHTHQLEIFGFDGREVSHGPLYEGPVALDRSARYIVNVGSVGQPRDGNNSAKYVIWDDSAHRLEVRFVPYDIAVTVSKIIELGFPVFNATRLW